MVPVPLAVIANVGLRHEVARLFSYACVFAIGAGTALLAGFEFAFLPAGAEGAPPAPGAVAEVLAGTLTAALLFPVVRAAVGRVLPIDPGSPVHALALGLTLVLLANGVALAASNEVARAAGSAEPLSRWDLILGEIPFVLAAAAGVGLAVRRSAGQTLQRLGLVRPAWWHLVLALAAAGLFYGVSTGLDILGEHLTPGTSEQVSSATNRIFGQLASDWPGIATIALAAGVCEEILFRGALQPRLGLLWTALIFASVHTQYGVSFDALAVLLLAVGLGVMRRYLNTTATILCHVAYNTAAGAGVPDAALPWLIAGEAVLLAVLGVTLATRLRPVAGGAS